MLRFHIGLFPAQAWSIAPLLVALAVVGVLYGACLALVQRDFWRLLLGALYDRYATSEMNSYGGLAGKLPQTATLFVVTALAMIGLPPLSGFVGEFIILSSTFTGLSRGWAIAAALGMILGAAYMLWLVQRIFYGPQSELTSSTPAPDLHLREQATLWPLALLMLVMGLAPSLWLPSIEKGLHLPQVTLGAVSGSAVHTTNLNGEGQR
jgi:NADH-quinone oxidoreductase subunit M